jgi:catalase
VLQFQSSYPLRPPLSLSLEETLGPNGLVQPARHDIETAKIGEVGSYHLFHHTMATLMPVNGGRHPLRAGHARGRQARHPEIGMQASIKKHRRHTLTHPAKAADRGGRFGRGAGRRGALPSS